METQPMPLDELAGSHGGLDEFRLTAPREIVAMLRQLVDGGVFVHLNASNGRVLTTTLWAIDTDRSTLSFAADADDPATLALLECEEAVVVAYLDSIKVQFDVSSLVQVRGRTGSAITTPMPRVLYRFQRRNAFRVRPLLRSAPAARVRHPEIAEMGLALRVMDVSIGGCALFLPEDVPPLKPGVRMNQVLIELDADTRLVVDLQLQHLTSINPDSKGVRLGCEFVRPSGDALRTLQRFIDQTQKRRRLMALD